MAILARIKKEQAEEAKKAKKIESETESKNAEKEAAAARVQEVSHSPRTMQNASWRLLFDDCLRSELTLELTTRLCSWRKKWRPSGSPAPRARPRRRWRRAARLCLHRSSSRPSVHVGMGAKRSSRSCWPRAVFCVRGSHASWRSTFGRRGRGREGGMGARMLSVELMVI